MDWSSRRRTRTGNFFFFFFLQRSYFMSNLRWCKHAHAHMYSHESCSFHIKPGREIETKAAAREIKKKKNINTFPVFNLMEGAASSQARTDCFFFFLLNATKRLFLNELHTHHRWPPAAKNTFILKTSDQYKWISHFCTKKKKENIYQNLLTTSRWIFE